MNKIQTPSTDTENFYADSILIDEGGVELFVGGELELGASFEGVDNFELAYRVLPEDFDTTLDGEFDLVGEGEISRTATEEELEAMIWIHSQELAERRGYAK